MLLEACAQCECGCGARLGEGEYVRLKADAGRPAACEVRVECERVKEEPELLVIEDWCSSEACPILGGKEYVVRVECVRVKEEGEEHTGCAAAEAGVSAAAARAGLYAGHDVKGELVLGPERLQPPDAAFAHTRASRNTADLNSTATACVQSPAGGPRPLEEQLGLRACSVRLARIPSGQQLGLRAGSARLSRLPELYSCDACGEQFARKRSLIPHVRRHAADTDHKRVKEQCSPSSCSVRPGELAAAPRAGPAGRVAGNKSKSHKCDICLKLLSSSKFLKKHKKLHSEQNAVECDICRKQFALKSYLARHLQAHEEKLHKCEICMQRYRHKWYLIVHKRTCTGKQTRIKRHMGELPFKCDFCMKLFKHKSSLYKHIRVYTHHKPYQSEISMEQFTLGTGLERSVQTWERRFKCDVCMKQFRLKENFAAHQRVHAPPFQCDVCMKRFAHKPSLKKHQQKVFKCEFCEEQFSHKTSLIEHEQIHAKEKPYKCDVCMKRFTEKARLVTHALLHTETYQFKCKICRKQFKWKGNFRRHEQSHTEEKQFQCDICFKRVYRKEYLVAHMKTHALKQGTSLAAHVRGHARNSLACAICGARFEHREGLLRHARAHIC